MTLIQAETILKRNRRRLERHYADPEQALDQTEVYRLVTEIAKAEEVVDEFVEKAKEGEYYD